MKFLQKNKKIILVAIDMMIFLDTLWISVSLSQLKFSTNLLNTKIFWIVLCLIPFWIVIMSFEGLFKNKDLILKCSLTQNLFKAQLINLLFTLALFFVSPKIFGINFESTEFNINVATILVYFLISSAAMYIWHAFIFRWVLRIKKSNIILFASGDEMKQLIKKVNDNPKALFSIINFVDLSDKLNPNIATILEEKIKTNSVETIIVDFKRPNYEKIEKLLAEKIFQNIEIVGYHAICQALK